MDQRMKIGRCGEQAAVDYLSRRGMTIIERNWSTRLGELDIIARDHSYLIFVEVRTTSGQQFGYGYQSIDWRKQRKVRRLAHQYMQQNQLWHDAVRFDVVSVLLDLQMQVKQLDYIPQAF